MQEFFFVQRPTLSINFYLNFFKKKTVSKTILYIWRLIKKIELNYEKKHFNRTFRFLRRSNKRL
jgi:hypothetical protein